MSPCLSSPGSCSDFCWVRRAEPLTPTDFVAVVCGSNQIPSPRLAEKYKECLSSKEKILKEIEVKKEYLSSLQPRLNSIMQVPELCREGRCFLD